MEKHVYIMVFGFYGANMAHCVTDISEKLIQNKVYVQFTSVHLSVQQ